jgi:acyl-CoA dehydrogenase
MTTIELPYHADRAELRAAVREFCSAYTLSYWDGCDLSKSFPEKFYREISDAGYLGAMLPEQYGGGGGTLSDLAAVLEEVAASGGGLNAASTVHIPLLCTPTLLAFGTDEQRAAILPAIARGELYVTFGVTEPDAGTDTTQISTKAASDGNGGFVISGTKVWNSGASRGDKILVLTRTSRPSEGERPGRGLTLFLTDLKADSIDIRPIPKIGRNAVDSCEVTFREHPVSAGDVVGEVGQGFYHLLHSLNGERLLIAAENVGMGRWALARASGYARERVVFGRPIGKNQAVQHPLADSYLKLLAASEVLREALASYERDGARAAGTLANAAKYLASEAAFACTDNAMQTFGGYSYAREYHIGRLWVEARLQRIAPVNNQMVLNYIAERVLDLPRSY